jgi:hypothetical protein
MTEREWLAAAKARCERATPGPWHQHERATTSVQDVQGRDVLHWQSSIPEDASWERANRNAAFIAHARTDLPRALAALEAALPALWLQSKDACHSVFRGAKERCGICESCMARRALAILRGEVE